MRVDILDLQKFYASPLGEAAARQIARGTAELWPDLAGETVVGIGYAPPLLDAVRGSARPDRAIAVMPAAQGPTHWPVEGPNLTALAHESHLPLADRSVDRVILVHALENADALAPFLREVWRVLTDGGRLLAIVANRRGLWCRADHSPFGHGRPFTSRQLKRALGAAMFEAEQETMALYALPTRRALGVWSADAMERFGRRWTPQFGGVVMIDARKSLYGASVVEGSRHIRSRRIRGAVADLNRQPPSERPG